MKLPKEIILQLLRRGDQDFCPILSTTVDLEEYAEKLAKFADFKIIGSISNIIGCMAYYKNYPGSFLFITHIWINQFCQKRGYGKYLLDKLINEDGYGFNEVLLEVYKKDETALRFYENNKFIIKEDREDRYLLSKDITAVKKAPPINVNC